MASVTTSLERLRAALGQLFHANANFLKNKLPNGPGRANGPCCLIDGSLGARGTTRTGPSRASLGTSPRPQGRQLASPVCVCV